MKLKTFAAMLAATLAATALAFSLVGCGSSSSSGSSGGNATTLEDIDTSDFPTEALKLYDSAPSSIEEFPTVSPDELKEMIDNNEQMVIVDVNTETMYADGHIQGAINLPWSVKGFTQDPELPRGVTLVFYCVCEAEEDSGAMALSAATDYGYRNIVLLKGGTPAWEEAGYELVAS